MEDLLKSADKSYLIIEDDALIREVYEELFEEYGITKTNFCATGSEALAKVQDDTAMGLIDFVILDLDLPEVNGREIIKAIRGNSDNDRIKVLIASGDKSAGTLEELFKLGADDFLIKPFTTNVLKRKLESLMFNHIQFIEDIDFLPIRPSTFRLDNKIPFDVFLFQHNRYRLLLKAMDVVHPTHLQLMEKFEIRKVYIEDRSEPAYQGYLDEVIDELINKDSIDIEDKAEFLSDFGQHLIKEACINPSEENMKSLEKVSSKLHNFFKNSSSQAFQNILNVDRENSSYRHALKTTSICVLLVNLIVNIQKNPKSKHKNLVKPFEGVFTKGLGDDNFKILTDAAMLHVVGLDQENPEEKHYSLVGSEFLKELDFINPKVAELVLHHAEYNDGTGAPAGLNRNQTSLLAKILSFSNFLAKEVFEQELSSIQRQVILKENASKFMSQLIEIFRTVAR